MNILYKLYARIYQGVFKLAIPILPYRNPIILEEVSKISEILNWDSKVLVVTDNVIISNGLLDYVTKALDENDIKYSIFKDVCPNPTTDIVNTALKQFKNEKCNCLIAIGGGSVMDTAKAIGALYVRPKKTLNDLRGILHVRHKIPTLIAIPTTCGTGSETTLATVITNSKTRHKFAINDFPLIPSYAVLDYNFIKGLPVSLINTTGLDALTHALEAYIGRSTTRGTRKDALEAIKLIFENIEKAGSRDATSLQNMLMASHKAGRAFSKSYVGYVHAIAHSLGGKYNIPHGYANAVILPHVLKDYGRKIYKKIAKIVDYMGLDCPSDKKEDKFNLFMDKLESLESRLNIDKYITCIKDEDIQQMAKYAIKEANPLYPVPVMWNYKKMVKMYYKIQGK